MTDERMTVGGRKAESASLADVERPQDRHDGAEDHAHPPATSRRRNETNAQPAAGIA
jgi:hypothetical protein